MTLSDGMAWAALAAVLAGPVLLILWILARFPLKPSGTLTDEERARIKAAAARSFRRGFGRRGGLPFGRRRPR